MGGHRPNLLPILKNPSAARWRFKFRRTSAVRLAPAGALVIRVQDLVNSARRLAGVRSADCDRVHLFGSRARIHREGSGRMRPDATGLWEPERVVIGDQNCFSQHTCGNRLSVHYSAGQLPGPRQSVVISLNSARSIGCTAEFAACTTSGSRHGAHNQDRYCFHHACFFCIENRRLSSRARFRGRRKGSAASCQKVLRE